jgi:hypothetical protein
MLGDLTTFLAGAAFGAQVVVCMGDTLTHLPSVSAVEALFSDVRAVLAPGGLFVATFRDYVTRELRGAERFIPVRADEDRILTCFLEYGEDQVLVHDILHERTGAGWRTAVSAYPKLRLDPVRMAGSLEVAGLAASLGAGPRGMVRLVGRG